MLTAQDRRKLMDAGFRVFRRNERHKTITECRGEKMGWYTHGEYTTNSGLKMEMLELFKITVQH